MCRSTGAGSRSWSVRSSAPLLAFLAFSVMLSSCSGDNSSSEADAPQAEGTEWSGARSEPCSLLDAGEIGEELGLEVDEGAATDLGACRYTLPDGGTLALDIFGTQTEASIEARTAGATEVSDGVLELRTNLPGAGFLVDNEGQLALLRLQQTDGEADPGRWAAGVALAELLRSRLGSVDLAVDAPAPESTDPCEVAPAASIDGELAAGDPVSAVWCAYRHQDGTMIDFRFENAQDDLASVPSAEPWPEAGAHSMWQGSDGESGGAGQAVVPVAEGQIRVTSSSPTRTEAELKVITLTIVQAFEERFS